MIQAPGALWDELASWLTDTELGRAASACAAMRSLLLEAMRPRAAERRWAEEREVARIERESVARARPHAHLALLWLRRRLRLGFVILRILWIGWQRCYSTCGMV